MGVTHSFAADFGTVDFGPYFCSCSVNTNLTLELMKTSFSYIILFDFTADSHEDATGPNPAHRASQSLSTIPPFS